MYNELSAERLNNKIKFYQDYMTTLELVNPGYTTVTFSGISLFKGFAYIAHYLDLITIYTNV